MGGFGWNTDPRLRLALAQDAVDAAVLRLSAAYMPVDTGEMRGSGCVGPSGKVRWGARHAAVQYRRPGGQWAERVKAAHMGEICSAAARAMGGK